MLKSVVPSFCSVAFIIGLPSAANPGQPTKAPDKNVRYTSHNTLTGQPAISGNNSNTNTNKYKRFAVSLPDNQGMKFVHSYIRNNDDCLVSVKERSEGPFAIIDSVLSQYGLPLELKYLAVIESELKPTARSRVGAKGPWQLMPGTAHELGLKVNPRSDERISFYKSTRAAARYLRDLHREFGDWLLVLAAYNGGPVPVYRAIHKSHSRNFWTLQRYLPAESRWHVKKFIATAYYFEEGHQTASPAPIPVVHKVAPVNPVVPVGFPETEDERFHRLMQQSAISLQASNDALTQGN